MSDDTVLVVTTADVDAARRLLAGLTASGAGVDVTTAAVVHRAEDGTLHVSDRVGADTELPGGHHEVRHRGAAAVVGAVVASVDALLLGNSLLSLLGASADPVTPEDVVAFLARDLAPGGSALMARLTEPGPGPVDTAAEAAGGTVRRWSAATLRAEIEADRAAS